MNLVEFYKTLLESLSISIDGNGHLWVLDTDDTKTPVTRENKPVVLPTDENIRNLMEMDINGKMVTKYLLFNPLKEDVIKGGNNSLAVLRNIISYNLMFETMALGETLIRAASDKKAQKGASGLLNNFLMDLSNVKVSGAVKELVDDKSIENWTKLMDASLLKDQNTYGILHLFLKKGGVVSSIKYDRLCTISSPLLEILDKKNKENKYLGITLRNKDVEVFKIVIKFILGDVPRTIGDNNHIAPGTRALIRAAKEISDRINEISEYVNYISDTLVIKTKISNEILNVLEHLDNLKREIEAVPDSNTITSNQIQNGALNVGNQNQLQQTQTQIVNSPSNVSDDDVSLLRKAMYGVNKSPQEIMQENLQQGGFLQRQQQQMMQQQIIQQPVLQQQMIQQPVVHQPVMHQPIVNQPTTMVNNQMLNNQVAAVPNTQVMPMVNNQGTPLHVVNQAQVLEPVPVRNNSINTGARKKIVRW